MSYEKELVLNFVSHSARQSTRMRLWGIQSPIRLMVLCDQGIDNLSSSGGGRWGDGGSCTEDWSFLTIFQTHTAESASARPSRICDNITPIIIWSLLDMSGQEWPVCWCVHILSCWRLARVTSRGVGQLLIPLLSIQPSIHLFHGPLRCSRVRKHACGTADCYASR